MREDRGIRRIRTLLERVRAEVEKGGLEDLLRIDSELGGRARKALEAASTVRMVKAETPLGTLWFCIGPSSTHYIIPYVYCTCRDYNVNVIHRRLGRPCYHLILQVVSEVQGKYCTVSLDRGETEAILSEIDDREDSERLRLIVCRRRG